MHSKYIFICSFGLNYILSGKKQISCSSVGIGEVHNKVGWRAGSIVESKYNRKGSRLTNTDTHTYSKLSRMIHYSHFRTKIEYFLNFVLSACLQTYDNINFNGRRIDRYICTYLYLLLFIHIFSLILSSFRQIFDYLFGISSLMPE